MKRLYFALLIFVLIVSLFGPIVAFAGDGGACYNIADADARSWCLARSNKRPDLCYNIQKADLRSLCLAEVRR